MYQITDLKTGVCVEIDGDPYRVVDYQHTKVARQAGMMSTKLKNLKTGSIIEKTFKAGDKIKPADVGYFKAQYLYNDGTHYVFMNSGTYEQFNLSPDDVSDAKNYLSEGAELDIQHFQGEPIGIHLQPNMVFEVTETVPGVKGDTVSNATKDATIETGYTLSVPLFIKEGEKVRVDTRTGEYMERVNA